MDADLATINPYLQQEVLTASPIRLRWLLVNRAKDLTTMIGQMWQASEEGQALQWIIRLRDILGELLEGVKDPTNPVSREVSDFYVFLLQMLAEVEQSRSIPRLRTLGELLAYEADTWQMVLEKQARELAGAGSSHYAPHMGTPSASAPFQSAGSMLTAGGFSLEV
jgi:flagellin-specific chaperone FliS